MNTSEPSILSDPQGRSVKNTPPDYRLFHVCLILTKLTKGISLAAFSDRERGEEEKKGGGLAN